MLKSLFPLACALLLLTVPPANAQTIGGGVKAGIDFANISSSGGGVSVSPSNRTGFIVGVFADLPVAPHFAIQPEALYVMKGASLALDVIGFSGTGTVKFDYLEIPVLAKVSVPTSSEAVPYVFAGPTFSFLLRAKATATGFPDTDVKSDFKTTDVGIAFGGGVQFGMFLAELRYTLGLTNIDNTNSGITEKNRALAIMAGIRF